MHHDLANTALPHTIYTAPFGHGTAGSGSLALVTASSVPRGKFGGRADAHRANREGPGLPSRRA
jgi:hypothetical protein